MSGSFEFSQELRKLNKDRKFAETLRYFKANKSKISNEIIANNKFITSAILHALIEQNLYDGLFSFIDIYKVELDSANFTFLVNKLKKKPSPNWKVINRFCDTVDVNKLDTTLKMIEVERKGIKKEEEQASDKEKWYAIKTKALFKLGQFQECYELSKQALEAIDHFHYLNETWFARKIALCKKEMGKSSEALDELLQIYKKKKEWYIQNEIAHIYYENGELEKSFNYAIEAISNFGELKYKGELLELLSLILHEKGEPEWAFKHLSLIKTVRQQEEWNITNELSFALKKYSFPEIPLENFNSLLSELRKFWNSKKSSTSVGFNNKKVPLKSDTGQIIRMIHNNDRGADGFIKYKSGDIYFTVKSDEAIKMQLKIGLKVEFKIIPSKDGKKEKAISLKLPKEAQPIKKG
jgi:tetratricopeptide (TPR) repeat protein